MQSRRKHPVPGNPRRRGRSPAAKAFVVMRWLVVLALGLGGAIFVALAGLYLWFVVLFPGDVILQHNIESILSRESPVFYSDGLTPVGVFFKDAHRQYVPYEKIPVHFVNAIVAAEDNAFFSHHGVDFFGVLRAMKANIQAGRVVQGGSTITQQAAKNLFKRHDRSLQAKLKELLFALRLEYHYSKEKILEFYANQFYVSGNGHGLGVAAKYYFDKRVEDLTVLECAFVAGSVKRPNYYNPFIKKTAEAAVLARQRARQRVDYVLRRMRQLGMITATQYHEAMETEIDFQRGAMSYPLNTLMDLVKEALAAPAVEEALSRRGIDNVATSGIRIITTVEKELQGQALSALRHELSRLDVRLRGYDRQQVQHDYADRKTPGDSDIEPGSFLFGRITGIVREPKPEVLVSFGRPGHRQGRIDRDGLMGMTDALVKYRQHRWSEADAADVAAMLDQLEPGDTVYVSVRSGASPADVLQLDLEKYPRLQGAVLALRGGTIRAMAGGIENHYFNRAVTARRPMGSVMKPLVYAAALQLGWNSIDPLWNKRDVFVYQKMAYYPRPDHISANAQVSMNWAGVHSENLATIWLLYHLCDRLSPAQFKELTHHLDLDRRQDETYGQYRRRVRDTLGVVVDRQALLEAAFRLAVAELEPDLVFSGGLQEYDLLHHLHYGTDFDRFLDQVELEAEDDKLDEGEAAVRRRLLAGNYLRYPRLRSQLDGLRRTGHYDDAVDGGPPVGLLFMNRLSGAMVFTDITPQASEWSVVPEAGFAADGAGFAPAGGWDEVRLGDGLSPSTIDQMERVMRKHYDRLATLPDYGPEVLYHIRDFRVLAGLYYVTNMGRALGISSELEPVLSFPLGSNVISLLESARVYEGLVTGTVTTSGTGEEGDALSIIARIEDSDGTLLYEPTRTTMPVVSPPTTLAVADILRNVVRYGTGRYAGQQVRLHSHDSEIESQLRQLSLAVPVLGKTGTANQFTNAAFAGFVPGLLPEGNGLTLSDGYAVAAYTGFDDNSPMVYQTTHISGAGGALPVWTRLANAILLEKNYAGAFDLVDITFAAMSAATPEVPLHFPDLGQRVVAVSPETGMVEPHVQTSDPSASGRASVLTYGTILPSGELEPARDFQPFWQVRP